MSKNRIVSRSAIDYYINLTCFSIFIFMQWDYILCTFLETIKYELSFSMANNNIISFYLKVMLIAAYFLFHKHNSCCPMVTLYSFGM